MLRTSPSRCVAPSLRGPVFFDERLAPSPGPASPWSRDRHGPSGQVPPPLSRSRSSASSLLRPRPRRGQGEQDTHGVRLGHPSPISSHVAASGPRGQYMMCHGLSGDFPPAANEEAELIKMPGKRQVLTFNQSGRILPIPLPIPTDSRRSRAITRRAAEPSGQT